MEGRRDGVTKKAAAPQGRYYGRRGDGGGGDETESDGSSGGVELSLRLRTGSSPPAEATAAAAEQQRHEAMVRRGMTIFYGGRVCAFDVTEIQAMEIISMANWEVSAGQRLQREVRHVQDRGSTATARCGGQLMRPPAAAATLSPAAGRAPRQLGLATPATGQAGLSMKRSLQRFLQKREARRAEAVALPCAGGRRQVQTMRH